jgi:hypothetical protein
MTMIFFLYLLSKQLPFLSLLQGRNCTTCYHHDNQKEKFIPINYDNALEW